MVDELKQVTLNGVPQWILCRGNDRSAPIVLFVHGGPGSPLMWYSRALDGYLLDDFVVVHWDQRGAGKSYSPEIPNETITLDQIVEDGLALVRHLQSDFNVRKIIIVGHSWGTIVAANVVQRSPEHFRGIVLTGTSAAWRKGEDVRYCRLLQLAQRGEKGQVAQQLVSLGPPPYVNWQQAKYFGQIVYELEGFGGASRQLTEQDLVAAIQSSHEYSDEEIVDAHEAMKITFDQLGEFCNGYVLMDEVTRFEVPVIFVQGEHDTVTPTTLALEYFDRLDSGKGKRWELFLGCSHLAMYEDRPRFLSILRSLCKSAK